MPLAMGEDRAGSTTVSVRSGPSSWRLFAPSAPRADRADLMRRPWEARGLALGFAALVRKKGTGTLDGWLAAATGTPLEGFAEGLGKDLAAVRAALETPWSTGPVEGRISRLKTIKRTMCGRAGFDLLRSRVLHAA